MTQAVSIPSSNLEITLHRNTPVAIVVGPDDTLKNLNIGQKFTAKITSNSPNNVFTASTDYGKLMFQTKLPLTTQHSPEFQVISNTRQVMLLITLISGPPISNGLEKKGVDKPFGAKTPHPSISSKPDMSVATNSSESVAIKLTTGSIRNATILKTLTIAPNNHMIEASHLKQTSSLNLLRENNFSNIASPSKLEDGTKPNHTAISANSLNPKHETLKYTTKLETNTPADPSLNNKKQKFEPGTTLMVRIVSVMPPALLSKSGGLPNNSHLLKSGVKTQAGVVLGQQGTNTIIQSHSGPLAIHMKEPIPPGSTITFEILSHSQKQMDKTSSTHTNQTGITILETREWKSLNDTIEFLSQTNAAIAKQAANSAIPRLDSAFTANVLYFLAALRGVDIRGLFGDAPIRFLQRSQPNLFKTLSDEFQNIVRLADDSTTNDWRIIPIPLIAGGKIEQIQLFMKNRGRQIKSEDSAVRFVVDINLSSLGQLQLDGLLNENKKNFELIIRTLKALTPSIEKTITSIFLNASEISGKTGGLTFKSSPPDFVKPQKLEMNQNEDGWVV